MDLLLRRPCSFIDWLTDKLTGGHGFSHAAIRFSDNSIFESYPGAGVVISTYRINLANWKVCPLKMSPEQELIVRSNAMKIVGHEYDWLAILKWAFVWLPFVKESKTKYICTEAVIESFQPEFIPDWIEAWKVSPNKCEDVFKANGLI